MHDFSVDPRPTPIEGVPSYQLLTAKETRDMLGISEKRVRQLIERGMLHPTRSTRNAKLFDRTEVEALVRVRLQRPRAKRGYLGMGGDLVARVFSHFERPGVTLPEIVADTHLPPDVIRYLYREWSTPLGATPPAPPPGGRKIGRGRVHSEDLDEVMLKMRLTGA